MPFNLAFFVDNFSRICYTSAIISSPVITSAIEMAGKAKVALKLIQVRAKWNGDSLGEEASEASAWERTEWELSEFQKVGSLSVA